MNPVEPSKVYRLLYPQVPAIVSCNRNGVVFAMPVVSIISMSNDPPLVGVAISPSHATHGAISAPRCFSVCWLDASHLRAVEILGSTPPTTSDKLKSAGLRHHPGRELGAPIIQGSVAALECSLHSRQAFGDHDLLVGNVRDAQANDDFRGYWRFRSYSPILYVGTQEGEFRIYRRPARRGLGH